MLHNTFSGNHADCTGAAVVMGQLATITMSRTTVAHSLVVGNSAAGVDWMEPAAAIAKVTTQSPRLELYNTTVANNESPDAAAGVYNASAFNSLLWGNRGAAGETEAAQLAAARWSIPAFRPFPATPPLPAIPVVIRPFHGNPPACGLPTRRSIPMTLW